MSIHKIFLVILSFLLITVNGLAQSRPLSYYVDNAKGNSPLLMDYQNQVRASAYDSLLVLAAYKPQVNANSVNSYAPVIKGFGYDGAITNGGNFSALAGVNKQLINRKVVNAQFKNIQLQNQSLNNLYKVTAQELQRTIVAQYITTYGDQQQLIFNREVSLLLTREEAVLKKLTQGNVYKQVDYLSFLVTLQQQDLQVKQQLIQFKNDFATLNYLSGITDTAYVELQDPGISLSRLPPLTSSVLFEKYTIDSLKLAHEKILVSVNYLPKINLYADAGYNSTLTYQPYKNFGTSLGVSATIPIYDGKQKRLQYSKIDIAERTRQQYKNFFVNQYNQQIAQFNQQLTGITELINDVDAKLKFSKSLIEVNGKLLQTGEVRIADYILALNNYLTAKNLITQSSINRLQIINQINFWDK